MNRIASLLVAVAALFLISPAHVEAQTQTTPVQHFVMSTTAGSFGGSPVAIMSTGTQLATDVSVVYEYISNPSDSSKPRVGSGLANYSFAASSILPASLKKKLLIDFSNYNLTLQAGAGVESLSNGLGLGRTQHIVGNFGVYGSYPLPGGHSQIGLGYKFIWGPGGGVVKVPTGQLNFTF